VEFLVEVADPPEDPQFGYTVNGLLVSDFITPHFYDPVTATSVRYSFGGNIPGPRQILEGGYLSWHDPVTDHWWQQVWFGTPEPRFRDLGRMTQRTGSLRSAIDAATDTARRVATSGPESPRFAETRAHLPTIARSTTARAEGWRAQVESLRAGQLPEASWVDGDGALS
jgi:hypothetical protein